MAAEATTRALAIDPGEPLALVEDGYRRYNENDLDRAAARVEAALAAAPDHPDALALAAALARAGLAGRRATDDDLARVRAPAERALALDPSQVEAAIVVAITLPPDDEEFVRRAVAILDRALDGAPGHPLLLGQRGRLRTALGQLAGARDDLARATTLLPDDPAFAVEHALVLARLEEDDLAIVAQDRAMDLGAERPELLASRLETLVRRRELARALADADLFLRSAGREEPGLVARVHLLRGMACHLSGEAEAALADARRAIALAGHPLAHALGVWARLERDDVAGALAAAEEVVQRYPRLPEALATRARARLASGQVGDALADAERAVASPTVTPQVRTVHAAALLAAGARRRAVAAARVACDAAGPRPSRRGWSSARPSPARARSTPRARPCSRSCAG
ncbi:MAG: hypothetical protein KF878_07320 [Planctomycetes bacterium]|nr:hypothetical protein [Planctomycetota bacterium]